MKALLLAAALSAGAAVTVAQAQPPAAAQAPRREMAAPGLTAPPAHLLPERVGGAVVYVRDLEAQRRWYETMLGFRVVNTYSRNGQVFEYILQTGKAPGGAFMGLMVSPQRAPGFNTNSRVVLPVPDPKGLADHFAKQGVYVREAVAGSAYFILDPEGNQVELYRLTTPRP